MRRRAILCAVPRNISFALTTPQFLDGSKDVTRRIGWQHLQGGEILWAVNKSMGLRAGEKQIRFGQIEVLSARREALSAITKEDVAREGFPGRSTRWFIEFFCKGHKGCTPHTVVTRIEFRKIRARG